MKKGRYSEEQIIGVLKQMEAGRAVKDLARELGVSEATLYTWKSKYGGLDVNEARRLKELEDENRRLKHMVADLSLDKEALKAVIRENGWSCRPKTGCGVGDERVSLLGTRSLQADGYESKQLQIPSTAGPQR